MSVIENAVEKVTVATWLPMFNGFGSAEWDTDFGVEMYLDEENLDYDDLDVDYDGFRKDLAPLITQAVAYELADYGVDSIKFEEAIISRSGYGSDAINCEITIDPEVVRDYVYENRIAFVEYLKSNYTSYDGFTSFQSALFTDWKDATNDFNFNEKYDNFFDAKQGSHRLGAVLQFIAKNEELTENDLSEHITQKLSGVFIEDYITVEK